MKRNLVCGLLCQVVIFGSVFTLAAAQTMPPIGIIDVDGVVQRAGRKDSTSYNTNEAFTRRVKNPNLYQ